jgi:long-subunit acyl-CoA synthetase (AMP-forming)
VCVPLPQFFSPEQRDHALRSAGVRGVVTDQPRALAALGIEPRRAASLGSGLHLAVLDPPGATRALPPATAKITFTSGTTGQPRGACLGQDALECVADSLAVSLAPLRPRRHLCVLPLATLLENVAGIYAGLLLGAQCVIPPLAELGWRAGGAPAPLALAHAIARHRPDTLILVPELLLALVAAVEAGEVKLDSLRFVAVGGARVSPALLERAERVGLPVFEGYGLSECGSVVTLNTPGARRRGSVGRPLPHARVRLAADGEVIVAGALFGGYVGEPPQALEEHATGDLGAFDADGFLYLRGRRRNVFITSLGRNLSPEWLEAELSQTPGIAQAYVNGEARPWVAAVVVPRSQALGTEQLQDCVDQANRRLPDHARIRRWIRADAPFSLHNGLATANGRNRRDALARRYASELEALYEEEIA